MSEFIAVYHCWSEEGEPAPYQNVRTPVVLSIATLRATSNMPVVVLDMTDEETDWSYLPDRLNFSVARGDFALKEYAGQVKGYKHLSRIFDIHKWATINACDKKIIYCDSDVFFVKDPIPLKGQISKFCWDGWNTGFFYYKQNSEIYNRFYELFDQHTKEAILSEGVRNEMKKFVGYDDWYGVWDEMILGYMKQKYTDIFDIIPTQEHATCRKLTQTQHHEIKIFHGNGTKIPHPITGGDHARGLLCLLITEFYDRASKCLDSNDFKTIFGIETLNYFKEKNFSLLENADYLEWIKDHKGMYELLNFNHNFKII